MRHPQILSLRALVACAALVAATDSFAFVSDAWGYLSRYQFGIDYTNSSDAAQVYYNAPRANGVPDSCRERVGTDEMRCRVDVAAGTSSGFGFVLQQAFRRQGMFHVDADLGLGVRRLAGELGARQSGRDGLPLRDLQFDLVAVVAKPYIQLGWTPASRWPDILLSFGPALQVAFGKVSVNGSQKNVVLGSISGLTRSGLLRGFTELEIVPWRFGDGAFSFIASRDFVSGSDGTDFYPGSRDGMDDFSANFYRGVGGMALGFGLKLVLNWP